MSSLSVRLALIAGLIPKSVSVCDVGCDHAYLAAYLSQSGNYGKITATDINALPLERAGQNLKEAGIDDVRLVLCDGLCGISREDADCVVIAGMGGEVISGIIERCEFAKDNVIFILQPMTAADYLRKYLAENGFETETEKAGVENGKIFCVIKCRFTGKTRKLTLFESRMGKLSPKDENTRLYAKRQYRILSKAAEELSGVTGKESKRKDFLDAAKEFKKISEEN